MDKFLEVKTFVAVVDGGSFVQAADALDMSKPAVSRHVAEEEITAKSIAVKGLIKVNVPISFGLWELAPLWPDFIAGEPQAGLDAAGAVRVTGLTQKAWQAQTSV
jgi:DNA-binding transcriptional LysR family regulator